MNKQERNKRIAEIGEEIQKELFPDMFGSVRFNLRPGRTEVNISIKESLKLKQTRPAKRRP